jgi:hypothetical protein
MNLEQMQQTLDLLNVGFIACLVLAAICLVVTVLMFIRFGIARTLRERVGLAARKTESLFNEENTTITDKLNIKSGALPTSISGNIRASQISQDNATTVLETTADKDFIIVKEVLVIHTEASI